MANLSRFISPSKIASHSRLKDPRSHILLVSQLCERGQLAEAVDALGVLVQTESHVSTGLLYSVLKTCIAQKNLALGRRVHDLTVRIGYETNAFLANHILRMYAAQGKLQDAMAVFSRVAVPNTFMWFSIISAYARNGEPKHAIQLYSRMRYSGVKPDSHVFVATLQACATAADLESGRQVHDDVLDSEIPLDLFVCNSLVDMYAKCGKLEAARTVFDNLATRDVVTWTTMIAGYAEQGLGQEALALYARMEHEGLISANAVTFAALLKACASTFALQQGKQLHSQILERGLLKGDLVIGTSLVDMYGKCGKVEDARRVFDGLAAKNVVTWTAMIAGYAENGFDQEALSLYTRMQQEGLILANGVTYVCLLKACANAGALQQGKQLHSEIVQRRLLEGDIVVSNCLVDMYAKCGQLDDARIVFDSMCTRDMVTWSVMIAAYAKCGRLDDGRRLFDRLTTKNIVIWTSMIDGYAEHGLGQEALALYVKMEHDGLVVPDGVTFASLLKACSRAGALQQGKQLHSQIRERGMLEGDIVIGNCLVEMYAKCGKMEEARSVFDSLPTKDVVTWNIMIDGYGLMHEGHRAICCFEEMLQNAIEPDDTCFTCLLVACCHEGLLNEGRKYFNAMVESHCVIPTIKHYTCMVDLLARAGHLDEAEDLLLTCESNDVGYMSLLNACRSYGDTERATRCFERLVKMDPLNAAAYVLMANTYSDAGRWTDVEKIEGLRKSAGAKKKPGMAGIEVNRQVRTFVVGETRPDISSKVQSLNFRLKHEGGHVPQTKLVLKPLPEEEKENELCGHAEKLALAYGLLNTPDGTPLLITKNLRMCQDCHRSTEIISSIERREITVRDAHRVHQFIDGSCSCGNRP